MNRQQQLALVLAFIPLTAVSAPAFYSKITPIPQKVRQHLIGDTWKKGCPVSLDDLAYLAVSYWGFDDKAHRGHIIINNKIAENTVAVFRDLYAAHFPIENMQLPTYRHSSAADNDSHGFDCYIDPANPKAFSMHAYGIAIDINPVQNPYEEKPGKAYPANGQQYLDRSIVTKGTIKIGGPAFNAFIHHGWTWGGFVKQKDYMHFRKMITPEYRVDAMQYVPPSESIKGLPRL